MCPCVTGHCCSAGRRRCDHTHQTIKTLRRVKERSAGPTAMTAQAQHSAHSHMTCRLPRRHHWSHEGDPTQSYSTPCQCQELQAYTKYTMSPVKWPPENPLRQRGHYLLTCSDGEVHKKW